MGLIPWRRANAVQRRRVLPSVACARQRLEQAFAGRGTEATRQGDERPEAPYWTGNKNAVAEVRVLRARTSGTAGKAGAKSAVKASAAPTGRELTERRIAAIRRDPHYVGDNKALRNVLIAEMTQLQQQLAGTSE